jgi:hypothetical protein
MAASDAVQTIRTCSMCHLDSYYMQIILTSGEKKTELCSTACFKLYRELQVSCKKYFARLRNAERAKQQKEKSAQDVVDFPLLNQISSAYSRSAKLSACQSTVSLKDKQ